MSSETRLSPLNKADLSAPMGMSLWDSWRFIASVLNPETVLTLLNSCWEQGFGGQSSYLRPQVLASLQNSTDIRP